MPCVAVITEQVAAPTVDVLMLNVALATAPPPSTKVPAGSVMLAGTVADGLLLVSCTVCGPVPADSTNVTVAVAPLPPATAPVDNVIESGELAATGFTNTSVDLGGVVLLRNAAEIVAQPAAVAGVVTRNVADDESTFTDGGTVATAALLLDSCTAVVLIPPVTVTVPVAMPPAVMSLGDTETEVTDGANSIDAATRPSARTERDGIVWTMSVVPCWPIIGISV